MTLRRPRILAPLYLPPGDANPRDAEATAFALG
jgi:hypothetical protein